MMIKKINNSLLSILFSWIIFFGTVYTNPDCCDLLSNLCFQSNSLTSTDEESIPTCIYEFHDSTHHTFAAAKEDFCCKKKICKHKGEIYYASQNSKVQKQSTDYVNADPIQVHKNKMINLIFDQYEFSQTTSIYILTQSFLC